jgi:hypothetical protein
MRKRSIRLVQVVCVSIGTTMLTTDARGQGLVDNAVSHVGIGVGTSFYSPSSQDFKSSQGIGVAYRWHGFHSGWGPTFGLDWHSTDFNQTLGSVNAPLGTLRMRALLAGFGNTQRVGRFSASATLSGGYAFNHLTVDGGAGPAFASTGISLRGASVDNSAVIKPDVAVWYDVAKHVGVGVSAAYLVARPDATLTTATGSEVRHLRADAYELSVGLVFGVWKKR